MMSSSEEFSNFFGSGHVPPLNDRTISFIESFLAFSLDSDFENYSSSLLSFFTQHFSQLFSINQENLSPDDDVLYSRLILSLSYLRPFYVSPDFFESAENCASHCLKNFTGRICQASFSFLCTHYCNQLKNPGKGLFSFIEWINQYFINCSKNVNEIDINFFIVVTSSMKPLLSRIIDYPQSNIIIKQQTQTQPPQSSQNQPNQQKQPNPQQVQQQQIRQQQRRLNLEKIPDFLTPIIEIIKQALSICTNQFSTHCELVIIKSLRLIVKFLEIPIKPSQAVLENLLSIKISIPDDVRYFHIHENYLLVAFCIPETDPQVVSQSLLLLTFAAHSPLSSNKRIYFYLQSLKAFFSKIQKKTIENLKIVMEAIWPLFGSPKINLNSHITVCEILYKMISTELLKSNPMLTTAILRELISCFDLLRIEFETSKEDNELELANWIDVNNHLITLSYTLISMEANSQDETERNRMIHPTLRMPLYKQMTKHMIFVLDVIVYSAETKDKINDLISSFAKFIAALTLNSASYFTENMILLLPRSPKQTLHITLHQHLIKKMTKPLYYYYCFFETILNHFDTLFLPSPTIQLLRITILVFNRAFSDEGALQANQARYYPRMCYNLYKFFLKGILSRNYNTMELLIYIIQSTSNNSATRLQPFIQNFKQSQFSIPNIIRYLCEDPRIEAQASSLAIFLYSFCDSAKTSAAEWYFHFIPAIESGLTPSYSILPFYKFTAPKFADQIPNFPKALQYRLITSLALSSSKLKSTDINRIPPTLTLLSRIPKIAAEVSRSTNIAKIPHLFIKIDGIEIDLDIIKDTLTMLKKTSPQIIPANIEYLCEIFEGIIMQIDFQQAAASEAVDAVAENVCKDRVDFLRKMSADLIDQLHQVDSELEALNIGPNTNVDTFIIPKEENQEGNDQQAKQSNESPESNSNQSSGQHKMKFSYHWTLNIAVTDLLDKKYNLLKALQIIFYFRVKHININGNNYIKTNNNANASSTSSSRDLSSNSQENEKEILETEEEKEKRYEDEILHMFLSLGNEANKTSFFESFFILIYSKVTSIFALKAIEIMAKNFDFTSVAHKLNAVVLHGAQTDYPTSKRIMNESIFPLLRRVLVPVGMEANPIDSSNQFFTRDFTNENPSTELSQANKMEIFKQYYNSCSHRSHNVSKLSLSGMRFFESLNIMSKEIAESRKRYILRLGTYIPNNQHFYIKFIFYKPFDDIPENPQLMKDLMTFIEKANSSLTKEAIKLVNAAPSIDLNLINFYNAKFSLKVMAYYLASLPPSPTTQTAWAQLLSMLREHSFNSFYEYFLKQLTKIKTNPSMPPDCNAILDIMNQFTKAPAQPPSSQQATPSSSSASISPSATPNISTMNLSNVPIVHDLELLRLMIMSNGQNLKPKAETYMITVLRLICSNQSLTPQCEQIGSKIIEILKSATHLDFIKVVSCVFEATINLSMKFTPIRLPLGKISERYATHLVTLFYSHLYKQWNSSMFYLFANMTAEEDNVAFRKYTIEKLKTSTDAVKEYVKNASDPTKQKNIIDIDFAINIFLSAGERITNSPNCTLEMFVDVIEIIIKLVDILPKDNHFTIYKPSIFIPMIGLCLPNLSQIEDQGENYTTNSNSSLSSSTTSTASSIFKQMLLKRRQINRELKIPSMKEMNQNLRDVSMMTNLLIPFFLSQPKLFLHYLFIKRFTDFVKYMFTTFEERKAIYDYIETMARDPDQIYSLLLCWQLMANRLKCFPEDAAILYTKDRPFHIGFQKFPKSPYVPSYLLHYTATMIASMKNKKKTNENENGEFDDENDFISVDDLADNRALLVESSMASVAVHSNIFTLEQACNTIPRFFHIVRFLQHTKCHIDLSQYLDRLFEIMVMIPNCSKPAHTAFRAFAPLDVGKDPRVSYFATLFAWANLYSAGQQAEKNFLYFMPVVLRKFQEPPSARERIFEQLTYCTMILLEKLDDWMTKFPQIVGRLPSAFEEIVPNLNIGKVYDSCQEMIERIKKKIMDVPYQEMSFILRFIPSLFASMSKVLLYKTPLFCPPALLPSVVLNMSDSKDFRSSYSRAMISCISVSGSKYSNFLINELHKILKKSFDHISDPLKTPFATICMWINEVTNAQKPQDKFFTFVSTYLEIFKPLEENQIVQEWINMKQPINSNVEDYILKNIPLTEKLKRFVLFSPPMRPVYIKNAVQLRIEEENNEDGSNGEINERYCLDALFNACWKTQWQEIVEPVRPFFFAKLILPKCMTTFVKFFTIKQITELINIALVSIIDDKNMAKFAEYYSALYPNSILTECFATVYKLDGYKTPLPHQTPYQAMKYLESRNFYDDSLGVLKVNFPEYKTAATFHQLSNYSTARAHYLNTMSEHEESYFFGLNFFRACDINLSLSNLNIPFDKITGNEVSLPFLQSYSSPNVFTSFFSPVFLPLLLRLSIIEGIHTARSALQQRQTSFNPSELIKQASSIVLKTIDKQTANVSNFLWKNSLLLYLYNLNEASLQPIIQEVLRQNRNYIACLLMKCGDTKGALKMFEMSLGHSIVSSSSSNSGGINITLSPEGISTQQQQQSLIQLRQQASHGLANGMNLVMPGTNSPVGGNVGQGNMNLNGFGSDNFQKTFKITLENFPRILNFAAKKQFLSLPRLLQFRILKELRYQIIFDSLINAGTGAPLPNQVSAQASTASGNINAAVAALAQQQSHSSIASSLTGHHHGGHHGPSPSQISAAAAAAAAAAVGSHGGNSANNHTQSIVQILAAATASATSGGSSGSQNSSQTSSVAAAISRAINNSNSNGNNGGGNGINNAFNQLNANIAYVLKNNNKLWIDTLVSILSTLSISIDQKQVFMRIQNELIHAKSERANFLIALSLGLVRLEEVYKPAFISTMLVKNISEDLKNHWMKWLQLLIQNIKEPPHEFLLELYKCHPIWFMMVALTPKPDQHFIEFYKLIEKNTKERRQRIEFDLGFQCLRKFAPEFALYFKTFQLRIILFQYMASSRKTEFYKEYIEPFDGDIEKVVEYCDSHPVVFTTKQKVPDFHTLFGFKFPTIPHPIAAVSFVADGENEACFKLTTVTGELRKFAVVSPLIYKFQLSESLLMFGLSKIFDKHNSLRTRSSFNFYPMCFPVYNNFILIAHYPLVSLQKIGHDNHIVSRLYKSYTKITEDQNDGPFSQRERKQTDLPVDTFQKAYAKLSKGSLIDFLFARQSFASHLALACALRFLFNFPHLSAIPGMMISGDGQRVVIPDFFSKTSISQIPITRGIRNALPDYIMHGSFTTTWMDVFDALQKNSETFRVYLKALYPDEQVPDTKKRLEKIDYTLRRLEKMSTHSQEETDCFGPTFPVLLVDNLIDCAVNVFEAQPTGFSWI